MPDPLVTKTDTQGQEKESSKPNTKWVVSARNDDRVALWEPDTDHPDGEAFVAGKVPAEVALTSEVNGKLRMGELREATPEEISKRKAQLGAAANTPPKGPWD
jgi:hypothetical protein